AEEDRERPDDAGGGRCAVPAGLPGADHQRGAHEPEQADDRGGGHRGQHDPGPRPPPHLVIRHREVIPAALYGAVTSRIGLGVCGGRAYPWITRCHFLTSLTHLRCRGTEVGKPCARNPCTSAVSGASAASARSAFDLGTRIFVLSCSNNALLPGAARINRSHHPYIARRNS